MAECYWSKESFPHSLAITRDNSSVAGVLDEPYSQLVPLSGVDVQASQFTRLEPCPSYVAWRAGMATPLSWRS
jgi:hypothetical protein